MEDLIKRYGYWAVLLGSSIEGESIILTAGVLAYKGYLSLPGIIAVSFVGTLIADQLLFQVGRRYGVRLLEKRPHFKKRAEKGFRLLHKYNTLFILSFRFIYGIRIISPIIIGTAGISVSRFTILNIIAAGIWSAISCTAGYLLGEPILRVFDYIKTYMPHYIKPLSIGVGIAVGGGIAFRFYRYYRQKSKSLSSPSE